MVAVQRGIEINRQKEEILVLDFNRGIAADTYATFLENQKDPKSLQKAQEIREIQNQADGTDVIFVKAPPGVAAYVMPENSGAIYYNIDTLGIGAFHEHIVAHEKIHLDQQKISGDISFNGFRELPANVKALFAKELGLATLDGTDERKLIEGCTELLATKKTDKDENCAYNKYEVPLAQRLSDLVQKITGTSLIEKFNTFDKEGIKNALFRTANYLVLEHAAEKIIPNDKQLTTKQQAIILAIGNHALAKTGKIINLGNAQKLLEDISGEIILIIQKTKSSVNIILGSDPSEGYNDLRSLDIDIIKGGSSHFSQEGIFGINSKELKEIIANKVANLA